ncbi:MAG: multiheme c-type cytochrome [Planctomycetota bacterium]|jgi:hypothetical protein
MSLLSRVVIVFVLLAGATLFVVALKAAPPAAEPEAPAQKSEVERIAVGPPAKPGVLDSHESCKGCHEEIYNEWMQDKHSQAWVCELFTELSKNHTDPTCWSCHAPRPIYQTGLNSPASERASDRQSGINCLTCHLNREGTHVLGPVRDPQGTAEVPADCGPMYDPSFANEASQAVTNVYCGICHKLHGTDVEFVESEYGRKGMTCLTCHMKEVMGPIARGGKPRARRVHRMPGAHSAGMLQHAMTIEPRVEEGTLFIRTINRGAGHKIPTDARHRAIWVRVAFFDPYGQPVPTKGMNGRIEREVPVDLIRLFYRHEQRDPTQIAPKGTLGQENWRDCSIAVPPRARGGRARIRLYYLLRVDWPIHKGTLVEEREVELG